ncbi:MAG: hypothetical protein JW736_05925 [Deltaproteobacteria bacterium]|nr:hypothetical protein [Deltaproteobacteria bacterium]
MAIGDSPQLVAGSFNICAESTMVHEFSRDGYHNPGHYSLIIEIET